MTLPVINHPDYMAAIRPGHRFPMPKYHFLREALRVRGLLSDDPAMRPEAASADLLSGAHEAGYVERALTDRLITEEVKRIGLPAIEPVIRRSRLACAGTLLAARHALRTGIACNAAGGSHHARFEHGAGYCVFNDVAVAIRALKAEGAAWRILVVDCDVHQGDGTAAIFAGERGVLTLSIHAEKNFPFQKAASDLDVGLRDGTGDAAYLAALRRALSGIAAAGPFDLVFYNAGVDVHAGDRLGRLALTDDGIRARDAAVLGWARRRGEPVVGVLGGGYGDDPAVIAARHLILFEEAARLA
jgi:acetoin utilization deacetylase AcuC-like enzyme